LVVTVGRLALIASITARPKPSSIEVSAKISKAARTSCTSALKPGQITRSLTPNSVATC
jgi:hypothetical protein